MQNITSANFEAELIDASLAQPVLLDIWAEWCGPCKALGPVLEKLETDYAGRFRLGKLDADAEPEIAGQLSQMFGVRSIPFCVLFKAGQPVDGFVGALPEGEVRKFLDKHVPTEAPDAEADSGAGVAATEPAEAPEADPEAVIARLAAKVAAEPKNDSARYDWLRALLEAGRIAEARAAYDPVAGSPVLDPRLSALGHWLAALEAAPTLRPLDSLEAAIAADKRDFAARFELAQRRFAQGEHAQAMDALLEILMRDKTWSDELARRTYVAILEAMRKPVIPAGKADAPAAKGTLELTSRVAASPTDPLVDLYRRKLSMVLF